MSGNGPDKDLRGRSPPPKALQPEHYDPFDTVGLRKTPGAFLGKLYARLNNPDWLLKGTSFADTGTVPATITVRERLTIFGNLAEHSPNDPFYIEYANAGVPLYYGALDIALRSAPNLLAALKLLPRFADDRPGYHHHLISSEGDRKILQLVPKTDLGRGRNFIVEMPLLFYTKLASRIAGEPMHPMIAEFMHAAPTYASELAEAFQCELVFGSNRDAISFPAAICHVPNISYDSELWRTSLIQCEEEVAKGANQKFIVRTEELIINSILEGGRVPRAQEIADAFGISSRTLIRHLRTEKTTFQSLIDEVLKSRSRVLLADSNLTISHVAEELGFTDVSGFHRRFRRWYGKTPTQFRQELIEA